MAAQVRWIRRIEAEAVDVRQYDLVVEVRVLASGHGEAIAAVESALHGIGEQP